MSTTSLTDVDKANDIVFMFLGGFLADSDSNLIDSYKFMFSKLPYELKDRVYCVVHPINLIKEEKETETKRIATTLCINQTNVYIVDDDNHINTSWATRSLSDATLLMMQYATIQHGAYFKKYFLSCSKNVTSRP